MLDNFAGMKEMYDVSLRLTRPLEIGGKKYNTNEAILTFKQVEIAQIQEQKRTAQARGGYHNSPLINWEIDKEATFAITNGVLSPTSWALLSNSQIKEPNIKSVCYSEELDCIEDEKYCYVELKYKPNCCNIKLGAQPNPDNEPMPMGRREELMLKPLPPSQTKWIFCYDMETGLPIREFQIYGNKLFFQKPYRKVSG